MKTVGIICEFNPFHNGHKYFINEVKRREPDAVIVLIMSGYFTERGEISVLSKKNKTEISLFNGVDLVLELPSIYTLHSADFFGYYAVNALNFAGVQKIYCGSESANIEQIKKINLEIEKLSNKKNIDYKNNLASNAYKNISLDVSSNDILAMSYLKAIEKINPRIELNLIKRTNDFADITSNDTIVSAQNIREKLRNNIDISKYVPAGVCDNILKLDKDKLFQLLKYKILSSNSLSDYVGGKDGLAMRIKKCLEQVSNIDDLINLSSCKIFTKLRIQRFLICLLLGFKYSDLEYMNEVKILGFSDVGQRYLKTKQLPNIVYKKSDSKYQLEYRTSQIFDLLMGTKETIYEKENKPIIYKKTDN